MNRLMDWGEESKVLGPQRAYINREGKNIIIAPKVNMSKSITLLVLNNCET